MNHVYLSDDEIKQLALPLLNAPGLGSVVACEDLVVTGPTLEEDPDTWLLEVRHRAGERLDAMRSILASVTLKQSVSRRGDPRVFVIRHRFDRDARSAA